MPVSAGREPLAGFTQGLAFDTILNKIWYGIRSIIFLLLIENNWNIVLHGSISWRAHVNIITWLERLRSLEYQFYESRFNLTIIIL